MLSNHLVQATPQIEAVIFDLDDTLISWAKPTMSWLKYCAPMMVSTAQFLATNGVEIDAAKIEKTFGRIMRRTWQPTDDSSDKSGISLAGVIHIALAELDLGPDGIDIQALMRTFDGLPMPGVELYPDTHAVLTALKQRGYKIGLITNSFSPMWLRDVELEHYGLIDYFDARITSGDTGFMKPHPAIFWRIMGLLNVTPDKTMFVGDSPKHDIAGANHSGMTSVLIDPPHLNRVTKSAEETPDHTIKILTELLSLLPETTK